MTDSTPLPMATSLVDTFGRVHNNLRISVTDRCNLRCTYCMPEEVVFMDRAELLTFEEITHFVRVAAPLGIDKLRLTGGEPLLRRWWGSGFPYLRLLRGEPGQVGGVEQQVAAPQPARFEAEPPQPFQPALLHPRRRLAQLAGVVVERGAHG